MSSIVGCNSQSRGELKNIESQTGISRYFKNQGDFKPLVEYQRGGWFVFKASSPEVEKFVGSKNFTNVSRFEEKASVPSDISNYTQFTIPKGIDSELEGQYLRFRAECGDYGVNGFYVDRQDKLIICFYR